MLKNFVAVVFKVNMVVNALVGELTLVQLNTFMKIRISSRSMKILEMRLNTTWEIQLPPK